MNLLTGKKAIALGARLRGCQSVLTLGVRPNYSDYNDHEIELMRTASVIYYPSAYYAGLFDTVGIRTFPSYHTYAYVQDKIKQTTLFQLLGIPHPKTRFYFGPRQQEKIIDHFSFPFIAKVPRGSAMGRGVYLVKNLKELQRYLSEVNVAYIQSYLPIDRDMRVVVIGQRVVHSYWRVAPSGDFRNNVAVGGEILFDPLPNEALELALHTARSCRWDDVGIDICLVDGRFYVLEANMKYGIKGFQLAGIDYTRLMEQMILDGEI
jgi:ribosomal protein S6--L-glutamate ligase